MADYMAARIIIGGDLDVKHFGALYEAVQADGAVVDYSPMAFAPESPQDVLNLLEDGNLVLVDAGARYGEFSELEAFAKEHGLSFIRHTDAKYEYPPCVYEYFPGKLDRERATDHRHEPYIVVDDLQLFITRLSSAVAANANIDICATELLDAWRKIVPSPTPDLPPFRFVSTISETDVGVPQHFVDAAELLLSMDWVLLSQQKAQLLDMRRLRNYAHDEKYMSGVIHLIDKIQDWAVDSAGLLAEEVYLEGEEQA